MKKAILNLGKALNKTEQKSINGGAPTPGGCQMPMLNCAKVGEPDQWPTCVNGRWICD